MSSYICRIYKNIFNFLLHSAYHLTQKRKNCIRRYVFDLSLENSVKDGNSSEVLFVSLWYEVKFIGG